MEYGNVWRRGMIVRDHLYDPHAPYCINFGFAKLAERGGRYCIAISIKQNNKQKGSHSLRDCMAW